LFYRHHSVPIGSNIVPLRSQASFSMNGLKRSWERIRTQGGRYKIVIFTVKRCLKRCIKTLLNNIAPSSVLLILLAFKNGSQSFTHQSFDRYWSEKRYRSNKKVNSLKSLHSILYFFYTWNHPIHYFFEINKKLWISYFFTLNIFNPKERKWFIKCN
jgi:hypothetical protein